MILHKISYEYKSLIKKIYGAYQGRSRFIFYKKAYCKKRKPTLFRISFLIFLHKQIPASIVRNASNAKSINGKQTSMELNKLSGLQPGHLS